MNNERVARVRDDVALPSQPQTAEESKRGSLGSAVEIQTALQAEIEVFLRRWGDTCWRDEIASVCAINDPELLRLVCGVAGIEDDAFYMQVKLRSAGVLRWQAIQQFNAVWLTEESDHGRAFEALALKLDPSGVGRSLQPAHGTLTRDRRAVIALPLMRIAGTQRRAMLGGYLVRGAIVEHVAIAVYGTLMRRLKEVDERSGAEIVRRILVQEGRHLRFFTRGAKAVLSGSPRMTALVRAATERTWRPPGVDLYGKQGWISVFLPVLRDEGAMRELFSVDAKLSALPGFEGTTIVRDYFEEVRRTLHTDS